MPYPQRSACNSPRSGAAVDGQSVAADGVPVPPSYVWSSCCHLMLIIAVQLRETRRENRGIDLPGGWKTTRGFMHDFESSAKGLPAEYHFLIPSSQGGWCAPWAVRFFPREGARPGCCPGSSHGGKKARGDRPPFQAQRLLSVTSRQTLGLVLARVYIQKQIWMLHEYTSPWASIVTAWLITI